MKNIKKLGLVGAGAAGTVALTMGVAGIASAQDDGPTLEEGNVTTTDAGHGRHRGGHNAQEMVDQLIEDGVITEDQANDWAAVREAMQTRAQEKKAEAKAEIAQVLGMSVEDLEAAHADGQTLAEIAGDQLPALVDLFTDNATERINEAVTDGRITQEQADERLDGLSERIENRLENGGGFGRRDHDGRRGPGARLHNADPTAEVPQQLLDRLAENGVDVDGVETFEDLHALRDSGAFDGLRGNRGPNAEAVNA
ncbi:MAG: hypothetical protein ACR2P0_12275 [Acidimicrobiales bacterium]